MPKKLIQLNILFLITLALDLWYAKFVKILIFLNKTNYFRVFDL